MKQLNAKSTVDTLIADHRDNPVFVSYYSDESHGYYHMQVCLYPVDRETRTKAVFDRLVKQGKLIASSTFGANEHYGPYLLSDIDYVSFAIAALREFIVERRARLDESRQSRRDYLAGIDRQWRPDIASYDWLKPMIADETALQFAEIELVFFLNLKARGIKTYDPRYKESFRYSPYADIRGTGPHAHLYRKAN